MQPFEHAWALLKTDFKFGNPKDASGYLVYPDNHSLGIDEQMSDRNKTFSHGPTEGVVNLGSSQWKDWITRFRNQGLSESQIDDLLASLTIDTARHEGIHEAMHNTPEMRAASDHAFMEHAFHDNPVPFIQREVVDETMANFTNPQGMHPIGNIAANRGTVKDYPWNQASQGSFRSDFADELTDESQKVRQGEWREDDGAL